MLTYNDNFEYLNVISSIVPKHISSSF